MNKLILSLCFLMMLISGVVRADDDGQTNADVNARANAIKPCPCNLYEDNNDLASGKQFQQQAIDRGNEFNRSQPTVDGETGTRK